MAQRHQAGEPYTGPALNAPGGLRETGKLRVGGREDQDVGRLLAEAVRARPGSAPLETRFRAFKTICRASHSLQEAARALRQEAGL